LPAGSYIINQDGSTTIYGGMLNEVVISSNHSSGGYGYSSSGSYSSNGYLNDPYFMNSLFWMGSGGYSSSGGYGGGGGGYYVSPTYVAGTGSSTPSNFEIASTIASNALATGLAFNEVYTTIGDAIFSNSPTTVNTNTLIKSVFDSSALSTSFQQELTLASKLDGIAILSVTGKVLGITGAGVSLVNLYNDYQDDGSVSMTNVADAAINVGSLFSHSLKSHYFKFRLK
jgi:hypothetical protein